MALILALTLGDWLVAGSAARQMVEERLSSTAQLAAESLPYFFETGQSLIYTMATPDLLTGLGDKADAMLANAYVSVRFFNQLMLFDIHWRAAGSFPDESLAPVTLTTDELNAIQLALSGVPYQMYTADPSNGERSAQLSFISNILATMGCRAAC